MQIPLRCGNHSMAQHGRAQGSAAQHSSPGLLTPGPPASRGGLPAAAAPTAAGQLCLQTQCPAQRCTAGGSSGRDRLGFPMLAVGWRGHAAFKPSPTWPPNSQLPMRHCCSPLPTGSVLPPQLTGAARPGDPVHTRRAAPRPSPGGGTTPQPGQVVRGRGPACLAGCPPATYTSLKRQHQQKMQRRKQQQQRRQQQQGWQPQQQQQRPTCARSRCVTKMWVARFSCQCSLQPAGQCGALGVDWVEGSWCGEAHPSISHSAGLEGSTRHSRQASLAYRAS